MATQLKTKSKKPKVKISHQSKNKGEKENLTTKTRHVPARENKAKPKSRSGVTGEQKPAAKNKAATKSSRVLISDFAEDYQEQPFPIKRASFVVRLTIDQQCQPGRTEIVYMPTGKKQNFANLDGDRLIAFMKACINPNSILSTVLPEEGIPDEIENAIPKYHEQRCTLAVPSVQLYHRGDRNFRTLILAPEESFILQAQFTIQGPDAKDLTLQELPFEIKTYGCEILSGRSQILKTQYAYLVKNIVSYTVTMELDGLPLGLYHLFTVISLHAARLACIHGRTFVQVGWLRQEDRPVTS